MAIWLVCEGDVEELADDTRLPYADAMGTDWVVVEADDAEEALALADTVDATDAWAKAIRAEGGTWAADRLAWHLAGCLGRKAGEELYVRFGAPNAECISRDHTTGRLEEGAAANPAVY
jgi:hypothetical protein